MVARGEFKETLKKVQRCTANKDDEAQQESIPQEKGNDPDLERAKKMSLEALQEKGEGEGDDADLERAIKLSLDPAFLPQGRAPVGGVTIRDPVSDITSKLHEVVGKGKAVVTEEQVAHSLIDLSKKKRTTDQFILVRRDQTSHDSTTGPSSQPEDDTSERVIHESSSTSDSERTESETETAAPKGDKDQGELRVARLEQEMSEGKEEDHYWPRVIRIKNLKECPKEIIRSKKENKGLIDAMDKEVADKGRSTKRRRSDSAAFGSAQPPPKDDDQSSKKPRESDASTTKQHPTLTSTRWQITDTRDAGANSSMHISDPELEHFEQSSNDILMQDKGNDSDMEDTDNTHIPKVSTTTRFKRTGKKKLVKAGFLEGVRNSTCQQEQHVALVIPVLNREAVRISDMRILSVISLPTDYFKDISTIIPKPRACLSTETEMIQKESREGMESRKWSEDDKEEAKTSSLAMRKTIDQKDLSMVYRKFCWRENKRLLDLRLYQTE
ncbi:hypothetical protein Tco_0550511 [Tanacetum coccineum]